MLASFENAVKPAFCSPSIGAVAATISDSGAERFLEREQALDAQIERTATGAYRT